MTRFQIARVAAVAWLLAAVQVAGFDRFLLFGSAHLLLPVFLAVAVGSRIPLTNAVIAGAFIGGIWDLLSIDLFGRYALGLAVAGAVSSLVMFGRSEASRRARLLRRAIANVIAVISLVAVSALAGETLPTFSMETAIAIVLSAAVGTLLTGRVLRRLALPTRTVWDPTPARSTDWVDHRAGLYSVPTAEPEREAA